MSTITYAPMPGLSDDVKVYSGGLRVGTICRSKNGGYYYQPRGTKYKGEIKQTIAAVQQSLEQD